MKQTIITPEKLQEHPSSWKKYLKSSNTLAPTLQIEQIRNQHSLYTKHSGPDDSFPLKLPHAFVDRLQAHSDWQRALQQFIPTGAEWLQVPGFSSDPVDDKSSVATTGVLHKYHGRVLILTTGACPVHCRYCFRRHFSYARYSGKQDQFDLAIGYIENHKEISEVILSGGDPLSLADEVLISLMEKLQAIPHVDTIRIHTRYPVIIPSRVHRTLCESFQRLSDHTRIMVILHSNHPAEIDQQSGAAIGKLIAAGISVLNQSVLLKGVNDCAEILSALSRRLHNARVLPYYLHMLDRVAGSHHFEVDEQTAIHIHRQMQNSLPGYLVPRLTREQAGLESKQLIHSGL